MNSTNQQSYIIGAALILAVIVGGIFYLSKTTGDDVITVTGSARMEVTSDKVTWRMSISQNVGSGELQTGYANIARDLTRVQSFLTSKGITADQMIVSTVSMMEDWSQPQGAPRRYNLRQTIEVTSPEVQKITDIAKNINELVATGVFFQTDSLEYYYSGLADARVSLLTQAVTDAKERAQAMANSSGARIGKLQSASSGVVQVLSRGSIEVSDYGTYDTSKIEKDVMVTVRATFGVK